MPHRSQSARSPWSCDRNRTGGREGYCLRTSPSRGGSTANGQRRGPLPLLVCSVVVGRSSPPTGVNGGERAHLCASSRRPSSAAWHTYTRTRTAAFFFLGGRQPPCTFDPEDPPPLPLLVPGSQGTKSRGHKTAGDGRLGVGSCETPPKVHDTQRGSTKPRSGKGREKRDFFGNQQSPEFRVLKVHSRFFVGVRRDSTVLLFSDVLG